MNRTRLPVFISCIAALLVGPCVGGHINPANADAVPQFSTLYSFSATNSQNVNADGAFPKFGDLVLSDGNFYATTNGGGSYGGGTVFEITPAGALTTLVDFQFVGGPFNITGGLLRSQDGNFYGTTSTSTFQNSGPASGTVFKVTPSGGLTVLHTFAALDGSGNNSDGANPYSGLVQGDDGNIYGVTQSGGTGGSGTIFKITPSGMLTTLYNFTGFSEVAHPHVTLIQGSDGNFYGTTSFTGFGVYGTIFKLTPDGSLTTLHTFTRGEDGANPYPALAQGSDGNFYGVTEGGGAAHNGTVFQITPTGILTTLHSFSVPDGGVNNDGYFPEAALTQGRDGNFYGTASKGGANASGTVFEVTPSGVFTTLYAFSRLMFPQATNIDGGYPLAGLTQGDDNTFYGMTPIGGMNGTGTIYKITVAPAMPIITSFSPSEGPVGSTIALTGTDLEGVTAVRFHDASAKVFAASADGTQLTVTVPAGAEKGTITVTTPGGSVTSAQPFRITYAPIITSFSPTSGLVGTVVTITGTHLNGITRVRFHNADASIYASSADGTQLTVTVPPGAATGTITLDNRDVLKTTSSGVFTVTP